MDSPEEMDKLIGRNKLPKLKQEKKEKKKGSITSTEMETVI